MVRVYRSRNSKPEDVEAVWFLWATYAWQELPHIKRRQSFPPPEEVTKLQPDNPWVALRQLTMRHRKPRARLKPSEIALLVDAGDWLLEQRTLESENAANLASLLQAAAIIARVHGDHDHPQVRDFYSHIAEEFGVMPPSLLELPKTVVQGWEYVDMKTVQHACEKLMRESELVPDWYFHGRAIPKSVLPPKQPVHEGDDDIERVEQMEMGDVFEEG